MLTCATIIKENARLLPVTRVHGMQRAENNVRDGHYLGHRNLPSGGPSARAFIATNSFSTLLRKLHGSQLRFLGSLVVGQDLKYGTYTTDKCKVYRF